MALFSTSFYHTQLKEIHYIALCLNWIRLNGFQSAALAAAMITTLGQKRKEKFNLWLSTPTISGVPRNFFGGGGSTNSVEDRGQRERGSGGGSPLVRGSGGSCNLVQEISFHMVKFS